MNTLLLTDCDGSAWALTTFLPRSSRSDQESAHRPLDPILDVRFRPQLDALPGTRTTAG